MVPNAVVRVQCLDELAAFTKFCKQHNLRWCTGSEFDDGDCWTDYRKDTVYYIEREKIQYSDLDFAEEEYLSDPAFDDDRPTDPRLYLCSVYELIHIVEDEDAAEDELDISFLDSLL